MTDALKSALLGGGTDPFAEAYLQLCSIAYADPSQIPDLVKKVTPLGQGSWQVGWGPATDPDDANLVYVAVYTDTPSRLPVLAVVAIRGTDVDISDIWGLLKQAWEDLMVPYQCPLPWLLDNPALVAEGTLDALDTIAGLTSNNVLLQNYLIGFLGNPANAGPVLVVTGHSLGGCLTTVVAPWLKVLLNANGLTTPIVPATFAAPTAGNADFARYYQQSFGYGMRVFNSLDIVPMAWANLDGIKTIYDPCNIDLPYIVDWGIDGYEDLLEFFEVSYAQPETNQVPLRGTCLQTQDPDDWYEEACQQHHTATYMTLLNGKPLYNERPPGLTMSLQRRRRTRMRRRGSVSRPNLERSLQVLR